MTARTRRHAAALAAAALTALPSGAAAAPSSSSDPFGGLGAWISIYDAPAWRAPERAVATLASHGVGTLYLETSNYRKPQAIVRPDIVARFVRSAHGRGILVVGWYLPSLANVGRDLRRAEAGAAFRTPDGHGFDGFALDIEATVVRSKPKRAANAVALTRALRERLPIGFPLGAITIDPVGSSPGYWGRHFPFRRLAPLVDAFLPMTYFTRRTRGAARVGAYTAANVLEIRRRAGDPEFPVHPIGGETPHATAAEVRAFVAAAARTRSVGASLWELERTTAAHWAALAGAATLR